MSETVQTAVRIGISGQFIDNKENFLNISRLFAELSSADNRLRDVETRLRRCNDPGWLSSHFENRCKRLNRDCKKELISLVNKLEAKKAALQVIANETRERILQIEPSAFDTTDTLSGPFSSFSTPPLKRRRTNPDVVARNSVIDRHKDQPDIAICDLLDADFPAHDGRPATGLPDSWVAEFSVTTYSAAYQRCRQRVQTLFSKRRAMGRLP